MKRMKLVSVMVMALCLSDVSFGAKTNPFIKGMTESEVTKLRRKAPYVDQVYSPETNEVHYDVILNRLKDTSKKISDVEENFINQVKRNLQREYWRQALVVEYKKNGGFPVRSWKGPGFFGAGSATYTGILPSRSEQQQLFLKNIKDKTPVSDYTKGFDNYELNGAVMATEGNYKIGQFMPEDFQRNRQEHSQVGYHIAPALLREQYYYSKGRSPDSNSDAPQSNMTTLEKIFNAITSGVENVNRVYAENRVRKEQEREDALSRAIKAEEEIKMREAAHTAEIERMRNESEKRVNQEREIARKRAEEQAAKHDKETSALQERIADIQSQIEETRKQAKEQEQKHTVEILTLKNVMLNQEVELTDAKAKLEITSSKLDAVQKTLEAEQEKTKSFGDNASQDNMRSPKVVSKLYEIVLCSSGMEISPWYIPMVPRDVLEDIYVRIMIKIRTYVEDFYQRVEDEEKTFRVIENIKKTLASFPKCPLAPVKEDLVREVWLNVLNTNEHLDRFLFELREAGLIKD